MSVPTTLKREPVVEAKFEIRVIQDSLFTEILPGILHDNWNPKPKIKKLPVSEMPSAVRMKVPDLIYAPLIELELEKYRISVGDKSVLISCKIPYPRWESFKETIQKVVESIKTLDNVGNVERCSMKFENIIEANSFTDQISKFNMSVSFGGNNEFDKHVNLELQQKENDFIHILTMKTNISADLIDGRHVDGVMFNVDSIKYCHRCDFSTFVSDLESNLENLKLANKNKFFSCLTSETIKSMEPIYD